MTVARGVRVEVNGVPLTEYGVTVTGVTGHHAVPIAPSPSVPIPRRYGARVTGARPALPPRRLTVAGLLEAASPAAFDAARDALLWQLSGRAGTTDGDAVTVAIAAAPGATIDRAFVAQLTGDTTIERFNGGAVSRFARVALTFECLDPRAFALFPTTVSGLSASVSALDLGTAESDPVYSLAGPLLGDVDLYYLDGTAATQGFLRVTVPGSPTVSAGHVLEVDMAAATVVHVHGGVRTPHPEWVTLGDFFRFDPGDAGGIGPTPPGTLVINASGSVTYAKAWR